MNIYHWVLLAAWLVFIVYWITSARTAKKTLSRGGAWRVQMVARILFIAFFLLVIQVPALREFATTFFHYSPPLMLKAFGAVCAVIGVLVAIWARRTLGRNWGMPMSVKENTELVTTGPYAYIRHPIYTGMFIALFGSALVEPVWSVVFVFALGYFFYSAKKEEALMQQTFPDTYPAYKKRTKMLIPFVF